MFKATSTREGYNNAAKEQVKFYILERLLYEKGCHIRTSFASNQSIYQIKYRMTKENSFVIDFLE